MKILILSTNTGSGHNTAAKAILSQAEKMGHSAVMIDFLMFASPRTSSTVSNIYTKTAVHTPQFIKAGAFIADKMSEREVKTGHVFADKYLKGTSKRLYKFISDNGFDGVIATHVFGAQSMTYILENYDPNIKVGYVLTDYTMHQFTPGTNVDVYFTPHESLARSLKEEMPDKNFISTGIPVSLKFALKTDKERARKQLSLDKHDKNVLVMSGSMGFGKVEDIIEELDKTLDKGVGIVAICAHNIKLRMSLQKTYIDNPRITVIGFTDKVDLYMDACDVLITKPGGLSVTEAAVKEIPMILSSPIPGWEEKNVEFFSAMGMSEKCKKPKEIAECAKGLLDNNEKAQEMLARQRKHINKNAAYEIICGLENITKDECL